MRLAPVICSIVLSLLLFSSCKCILNPAHSNHHSTENAGDSNTTPPGKLPRAAPVINNKWWKRGCTCAKKYCNHLYALIALMFLWIFSRAYRKERQKEVEVKISPEDIALLHIIKVNASMVCDKYQKKSKVVNLDDWRE